MMRKERKCVEVNGKEIGEIVLFDPFTFFFEFFLKGIVMAEK